MSKNERKAIKIKRADSGKPTEKDFYISVQGMPVKVSKTIYLEYYQSKRRDRKFEFDLKHKSAKRNKHGEIIGYRPAKEVSLDELLENGECFADDAESTEDTTMRNIRAEILRNALTELTNDERELIEALYFSNNGSGMTEREYSAISGILQKTVNNRKRAILSKLRKFMQFEI